MPGTPPRADAGRLAADHRTLRRIERSMTTAMHEERRLSQLVQKTTTFDTTQHERHDRRRVRRVEGRSRSRRGWKVAEDESTTETSLALVIVWLDGDRSRARPFPDVTDVKRHLCAGEATC